MTLRVGLNALFLRYPNSGTGRYLRHLIDGIPGRVDLQLISAKAFQDSERKSSTPRRLDVSTPFDRVRPALAKVWFEQVAFGLTVRGQGCDLGHVPYFAPALAPLIPTVVTVHDLVTILNPDYRQTAAERLYVALVVAGLRAARVVITDSEASARDLIATVGVPAAKIRVIPLGVDERFHPARDEAERATAEVARRACGIEGPYLLCLTGFDRRKNVDRLIEAFALTQRKYGVEQTLIVVGGLRPGGRFFFDPRPAIEKWGLSDRVRLLGSRSDEEVWGLLNGADAFVFPSLYEGFGLPPLEAMACGTPVICSNTSSLPEVVGDAGVLFDPRDVEGMADALGRVLRDRALRENLSNKSIERASLFSWSTTVDRTVETYRKAVQQAK